MVQTGKCHFLYSGGSFVSALLVVFGFYGTNNKKNLLSLSSFASLPDVSPSVRVLPAHSNASGFQEALKITGRRDVKGEKIIWGFHGWLEVKEEKEAKHLTQRSSLHRNLIVSVKSLDLTITHYWRSIKKKKEKKSRPFPLAHRVCFSISNWLAQS